MYKGNLVDALAQSVENAEVSSLAHLLCFVVTVTFVSGHEVAVRCVQAHSYDDAKAMPWEFPQVWMGGLLNANPDISDQDLHIVSVSCVPVIGIHDHAGCDLVVARRQN